MFCKNCGKEMPETSKFCASCGTKVDAKQNSNGLVNEGSQTEANLKTVKVIISRTKRLMGCAVPMKIIIDGNQIASLKNGANVEIDLPVGEHKLLIDTVGEVTDRVLNLTQDLNKVRISLIMKMGLVTGKAAIESIENE